MATSTWKRLLLVLALLSGMVLLIALIVLRDLSSVQPRLHPVCTTDSPQSTLIAPAKVYADSQKWSTSVGPTSEITTIPAGTIVCVIAHDNWSPRYALIVFTDLQGTGNHDVRGWVELGTLPAEVTHWSLSLRNPWES